MVEALSNFRTGLQAAYDDLRRAKKLTEQDVKVIGRVLSQPVLIAPDGTRVLALKRAHIKIRRFYCASQNQPYILEIDWTAIITWIKENWVTILKILLTIVPFLI